MTGRQLDIIGKALNLESRDFLKTGYRKLILRFLSYKMGIIMPSSKGCYKDY